MLRKILTQLVSALGRWWPCACLKCVFSLRRLEKTLKLLKCIHVFDLVLKYALDINEGNCLQLLFYFIVLMGVVASVMGICFFQQCFRFQNEVFSYCSLTETFANGFQMWFDHEWIDFGFFLENGFLRWLQICLDWNLQKLLIFYCFWRHQFFRCLGWGVFWSVL